MIRGDTYLAEIRAVVVLGGRVDNSTVNLAAVFLKLDIVEEGGGLVAILFVAGLGNHYTHCQGIDNLQAFPPQRHIQTTPRSVPGWIPIACVSPSQAIRWYHHSSSELFLTCSLTSPDCWESVSELHP